MSKIFAIHRLADGTVVSLPPAHIGATVASSNRKSNAKPKKQTFHGTQPQSHIGLVTSDGVRVAQPSSTAVKLPSDPIAIKAKTATQRLYLKELQFGSCPYVVAHGSAGGGKTYLAVLDAVNKLIAGDINKLVITRPMVGAGNEELGFLPGDVANKCLPWAIAIIDALEEVLPALTVAKMIETKQVEFAPLALMRGRTLKKALVILDEAQNCSPEQVLTCLSRLGEGSRMVITGDERQHDLEGMSKSGLPDLLRRLRENPELAEAFSVHTFRPQDSVRHPAIENVLHLYGQ